MGNSSSSNRGVCIVSAHEMSGSGSGDYKTIHRIKTTTTKASCDGYKSSIDNMYGDRSNVFTTQYFRKT